jgi:hypothetical protein
MELLFLICAESASIDQGTKRLSLFNIVEEIGALAFPGTVQSAALVMMAERQSHEPDQPTFNLSLLLNAKRLHSTSLVVQFQQQMRCKVIASMNGVPLSGPGRLEIDVEYNGKSLGRWPIQVMAIPGPVMPSTQQMPSADAVSAVAPQRSERRQASKKAAKQKKS